MEIFLYNLKIFILKIKIIISDYMYMEKLGQMVKDFQEIL